MKTESEIQQAGKKMPYTVPDGFFDRITGDTLAEVKSRQKSRRRKIILWSSLAAVASLAALMTVGILVFPLSSEKTGRQSVQNTSGNHARDSLIVQKVIIKGKPADPDNSSPTEKNAGKIMTGYAGEENNLEDVLASLSDEELLQLAARLRSDIFTEESNNN
jgi:hypothetical protein